MLDIMGSRQIIKEEHGILPLSLPYEVVNVSNEYASLSNRYRERLTFEIAGEFTWDNPFGDPAIRYRTSIPELLGKRISLSYVAATERDAEVIKSYLPEVEDGEEIDFDDLPSSLPAYLIKVKPQLIIDGEVVAVGPAVTMGTRQHFFLDFHHPTANVGKDSYTLTAGESYVVNINNGRVSGEHLDEKLASLREMEFNLENENFDSIAPDAFTGDLLHTIGMAYYAQVDTFNSMLQQQNGIRSVRMTSAGLTAVNLDVEHLFGMPRNARPGGLSIDLQREFHNSRSIDGDEDKVRAYNRVSGVMGSYMEGHIFAQMFGGEEEEVEPVSTIHILNHANREGIPVYTINEDNLDEVLPQLQYSDDKKQMFRNFVNNGREITVPQRNVTIGGWTGTGYIVMNEDGTGAYMISGGLAGGYLIAGSVDWASWTSLILTILGGFKKGFSEMSTVFDSVLMFVKIIDDFNKYGTHPYVGVSDLLLLSLLHLLNFLGTMVVVGAIFGGLGLSALIVGVVGIYLSVVLRKYWIDNWIYI